MSPVQVPQHGIHAQQHSQPAHQQCRASAPRTSTGSQAGELTAALGRCRPCLPKLSPAEDCCHPPQDSTHSSTRSSGAAYLPARVTQCSHCGHQHGSSSTNHRWNYQVAWQLHSWAHTWKTASMRTNRHLDTCRRCSPELRCGDSPNVHRWMDRHAMVCPCNGIPFSLNKEGNPDTCHNADEPAGYYE